MRASVHPMPQTLVHWGFALPFRHRPFQLERLFSCFEAVLHHLEGRPQRYGLQPFIFGKSPRIANSSAHCVFGAINRKSVCADFISGRSGGVSVEDVADPVTDDMPRMHHREEKMMLLSWCGVEANPQAFPRLMRDDFLPMSALICCWFALARRLYFTRRRTSRAIHIAR